MNVQWPHNSQLRYLNAGIKNVDDVNRDTLLFPTKNENLGMWHPLNNLGEMKKSWESDCVITVLVGKE